MCDCIAAFFSLSLSVCLPYYFYVIIVLYRAGLRHVRGVQPNRAAISAKFRGAAILDPTKIKLPVVASIFVNSFR